MNLIFSILYSFGKIGLISLGGGNSMLKLLEFECVHYRHWIQMEEFVSMVGASFLFPGLTAVKLAAFIGYKISGLVGLIIAVIAINLPGLILATVGYQLLTSYQNTFTHKLMIAVQYGSLALLAAASYSIAEGVMTSYFSVSLLIVTLLFFLGLVYLSISPFWGFIVFIVVGFFCVR